MDSTNVPIDTLIILGYTRRYRQLQKGKTNVMDAIFISHIDICVEVGESPTRPAYMPVLAYDNCYRPQPGRIIFGVTIQQGTTQGKVMLQFLSFDTPTEAVCFLEFYLYGHLLSLSSNGNYQAMIDSIIGNCFRNGGIRIDLIQKTWQTLG